MTYKFRMFNFSKKKFYHFDSILNFHLDSCDEWSDVQICSESVDLDGNLIYEGDILEFFYKDNRDFEFKYNKQIPPNRWNFIVTFECGCLGVIPLDKKQHNPVDWEFTPLYSKKEGCFIESENCKIVGNIFEKTVDLIKN